MSVGEWTEGLRVRDEILPRTGMSKYSVKVWIDVNWSWIIGKFEHGIFVGVRFG